MVLPCDTLSPFLLTIMYVTMNVMMAVAISVRMKVTTHTMAIVAPHGRESSEYT